MRTRTALASMAIAATALGVAGQAQATPHIAGASVTATRFHPECPREFCLRLTFRAWEPDQYRGERVRWRLIAYRFGDNALVGNWNGTFRNSTGTQTWWTWPTYRLRRGQYIARLVITSGRGKARVDRFFRVS